MNRLKLLHLFVVVIISFSLASIPFQSEAAHKSAHKTAQPTKERLVLMPLRVPEEDKNLTGAMETALVKGLQQKYDVYSGEQVSQKAREIFMMENRNAAHKECDETKCMQNIAIAFQSELIATSNVTKQDGSYFLALSIKNIFDNKVVYSESMPCRNCDAVQVVEKLKELSGTAISFTTEADNKKQQLRETTTPEQDTPNGNIVSQGGLLWMPIIYAKNWPDAIAYCSKRTINGQTGWRLPTKGELQTLSSSGAIDGQGWKLGDTWSSTIFIDPITGEHTHLFVKFKGVGIEVGWANWGHDTDDKYVTCVHELQ
jgi:hypothetical protein